MYSRLFRRRDLPGLVYALAVPGRAQKRVEPLFEVAALDHINIRASNPTRSAHFYQRLFGNELLWIEKIPPNPTSPAAESWYLMLGRHYLSISPAFPNLQLGPDLDHICPALRRYEAAHATALLKERGIEALSGGGLWMRDRDGMLYQLRDDRGGGPARPPAQAKPKAGDTPATATAPFAPVAIREITLRVADLSKAAEFYENVFGVTATPPAERFNDRRQARNYRFGDSNLRLVSRPSTESNGGLLDRLSIAVKDFSADRTGRILRDRGIPPRGENGQVVFSDPDGIAVELTSPAA